MSLRLAASLIAFSTFFSSLWTSATNKITRFQSPFVKSIEGGGKTEQEKDRCLGFGARRRGILVGVAAAILWAAAEGFASASTDSSPSPSLQSQVGSCWALNLTSLKLLFFFSNRFSLQIRFWVWVWVWWRGDLGWQGSAWERRRYKLQTTTSTLPN